MTLNKTWELCLSMWRWIAKEIKRGNTSDVDILKREWMQNHGFKIDKIENDCFFCEYYKHHKTRYVENRVNCNDCPGTKVDRKFDCMDYDYYFYDEPVAFYNKLRALNKKRKK